ncbi:hypothetical protein SB2_28555 [Methylobacterium radiotolerans]|nr:hypothetical protein SB3_06420 [Methylobacterium radiotolerans]KTS43210.1 hypothetical protein SB2_28555 [Methylobacterium radiotolerans]
MSGGRFGRDRLGLRSRIKIRAELMTRHPRDPLHLERAKRRHALPLRERLRGDRELLRKLLSGAYGLDCP